jgi:NAD(P)-dependent dehydrogenase (short-subunit alcohol dehydrogenase family)
MLDRRCVGVKADMRDPAQVANVMDTAASEFGQIDILVVNHGICSYYEIKGHARPGMAGT